MLLPPQQLREKQFSSPSQDASLYTPDTSTVVSGMVQQTVMGNGSLYYDLEVSRINEAESKGSPKLSEEIFKLSEDYRDGMQYYPTITEESQALLAKHIDESAASQEAISRASSGQLALGLAASLPVGVFEPKNLGYGIATSLALGPILGATGTALRSTRMMVNMKRANSSFASSIGAGAVDGLVSAAIMEPSNRYSAATLQEDYTMADSLFNVATSTILGAGISSIPHVYSRFKEHANKLNAYDTTLHEIDTASNQFMQGQKVDIEHVEALAMGDITKKPIEEQVKIAEQAAGYTQTPEFKERVADSVLPIKIMYRGAGDDLGGVHYSDNPSIANSYTAGEAPRVEIAYPTAKNPLEIEGNGALWNKIEFEGKQRTTDEIVKISRERGYDAVVFNNIIDRGPNGRFIDPSLNKPSQVVVLSSKKQAVSAFGADDYHAIVNRLQAENQTKATAAITRSLDPLNDTALDTDSILQMDEVNPLASNIEKSLDDEYQENGYRILEMYNQGKFTQAELDEYNAYVSQFNDKSIDAAYKALEACLTRG